MCLDLLILFLGLNISYSLHSQNPDEQEQNDEMNNEENGDEEDDIMWIFDEIVVIPHVLPNPQLIQQVQQDDVIQR